MFPLTLPPLDFRLPYISLSDPLLDLEFLWFKPKLSEVFRLKIGPLGRPLFVESLLGTGLTESLLPLLSCVYSKSVRLADPPILSLRASDVRVVISGSLSILTS